MKKIIVQTCEECPYQKYDNGRGHCGPSRKCKYSDLLLWDDDGVASFDVKSGIHPKCRLPEEAL